MPFVPKSDTRQEVDQPKPVVADLVFPNLPTIKVTSLPSGFKPYPKGAMIVYRPYTHGEVKSYSQSKMDGVQSLQFALKGIRASFPVEEITLSDMLYISLLRKISTFGNDKFTINYLCSGCNRSSQFVVASDELNFDDLGVPELPIFIDFSDGTTFGFKPLTIGGYMELFSTNEEVSDIMVQAKECVTHSFEVALEAFNNAVFQDGELLDFMDSKLYHGLSPILHKCTNEVESGTCGFETKVEIDGGNVIVGPFRERPESFETRVRFGSATKPACGESGQPGLRPGKVHGGGTIGVSDGASATEGSPATATVSKKA